MSSHNTSLSSVIGAVELFVGGFVGGFGLVVGLVAVGGTRQQRGRFEVGDSVGGRGVGRRIKQEVGKIG